MTKVSMHNASWYVVGSWLYHTSCSWQIRQALCSDSWCDCQLLFWTQYDCIYLQTNLLINMCTWSINMERWFEQDRTLLFIYIVLQLTGCSSVDQINAWTFRELEYVSLYLDLIIIVTFVQSFIVWLSVVILVNRSIHQCLFWFFLLFLIFRWLCQNWQDPNKDT